MNDVARWWDALGVCATCHKPAHGVVRGPRNETMGNYCTKCGNARVAKAQKARDAASTPLKSAEQK